MQVPHPPRTIRCKIAHPMGRLMPMARLVSQAPAELQAFPQGNIKCPALAPHPQPLATYPLRPQEEYQATWLGVLGPRACPLT